MSAAPTPNVSVVIPSWNTRDLLATCLESLRSEGSALVLEMIVVDNASSDGTVEMVRERFPDVRLVRNVENRGFGAAANQGAAAGAAPVLLFLNSDARPEPGALAKLHAVLQTLPGAAVIGGRLVHADGSFQASHVAFPGLVQELLVLSGLGRLVWGPWYPSHGPEERDERSVDYVVGACMMVRRSAFEQVGGFDEDFFLYAEEVDLCRRLRDRGWEIWYEPAARIVHAGAASSGTRASRREADLYAGRVRYLRKHRGAATAATLKVLVYAFTAAKIVVHGALRLLTGGRHGRQVVRMSDLVLALRKS